MEVNAVVPGMTQQFRWLSHLFDNIVLFAVPVNPPSVDGLMVEADNDMAFLTPPALAIGQLG